MPLAKLSGHHMSAVMANSKQHTSTLESKIDFIMEKMMKLDSIERNILLVQQDVNGIKSDIKQLDNRMTDIENSMAFMETDYTEIKEDVMKEKQKTVRIEKQIKQLQTEQKNEALKEQVQQIEHLKTQNEILSRQMSEIDAYNRRSNLIFEGISESAGEVPWKKIQHVLETYMDIDTSEMKIERCHRLMGSKSSPKPIIIRFNWYADRHAIWENRRALKGKHVYIREDFPPSMQKARRSLNHTLSLAKTADKKATLKSDKLIFKGKAYAADSIPTEVLMLGEAGPGARVENGHVCFSGRASPFSNFYRAPFMAEGKLFKSVEHYYQYHKAKFSNDEQAAVAILSTGDPAQAKHLGNKVRVKPEWYGSVCLNIMTSGIVLKFQQNPQLLDLLVKCAPYKFAECSQFDKYWGNGLKLTDEDVGNPSKWKGRNMLGSCLKEASKHFRAPYSKALKG